MSVKFVRELNIDEKPKQTQDYIVNVIPKYLKRQRFFNSNF